MISYILRLSHKYVFVNLFVTANCFWFSFLLKTGALDSEIIHRGGRNDIYETTYSNSNNELHPTINI